jgi:hypothetical protein
VGTALLNRKVNLEAAALTLTSLLRDGDGHDIGGLPLTIDRDSRNNTSTAYFRTAVGAVPFVTVAIRDRGRGRLTFRIQVGGGTYEASSQCPNLTLTTSFVLDDGVPVSISTKQPWLCFGENRYLRSLP